MSTDFFMLSLSILISFVTGLIFYASKTFCSGSIVKVYNKQNKCTYSSLEKHSEAFFQDLPQWINNYERPVATSEIKTFVGQNSIDLFTTDKTLYAYNASSHLPFDWLHFSWDLLFSRNILLFIFFCISITVNIILLWLVFVTIKCLRSKIIVNFNYLTIFFVILSFSLIEYIIFTQNLITRYPEEWSAAFIFIFFLVFLDLFWGATLLDFKLVNRKSDAYILFYGLHFEFLTFTFLVLFSITYFLNFLELIEPIGLNEVWTKWD